MSSKYILVDRTGQALYKMEASVEYGELCIDWKTCLQSEGFKFINLDDARAVRVLVNGSMRVPPGSPFKIVEIRETVTVDELEVE